MKDDFSMQLEPKQKQEVKLEFSNDYLENIHTIVKGADKIDIKRVGLSQEALKNLKKKLPEPQEGTIEVTFDEKGFLALYRLITACSISPDLVDLDNEIIEELEADLDDIFHNIQGHRVSKDEKNMIRDIINTHRKTLEEWSQR